VLGVDATVARRYGEIRGALRRIGRPIPENDVWIAATALRYDLMLVSRDSRFEHVADLELERWGGPCSTVDPARMDHD
jgi:tRNA(fMet)-specific endonuclease VapC